MKHLYITLFAAALSLSANAINVYNLADYGVVPNTDADMAPVMEKALIDIKAQIGKSCPDSIVLNLQPGVYNFHSAQAPSRTYFISNHDQPNPKAVGIALEGWTNTTLAGNGATLMFHGRMLPVALIDSRNCSLTHFTVDFVNPHISQVQIIDNNPAEGIITYRPSDEVNWRIDDKQRFLTYGEGWEMVPVAGIAFDDATHHMVYRTSDIGVGTSNVKLGSDPTTVVAPWKDPRLTPGTIVAMRSWYRPAPGIFMYHDTDTRLINVSVHYAEGMGLLAQMCHNITLDGFNVCIPEGSGRYFTTQADATHFSGCSGTIISQGGLYEGMMDDAINVHGTYLKVTSRPDDKTITARYMHPQTYGFDWGYKGDTVQFVASASMDLIPGTNVIKSIEPIDEYEFRIRFKEKLPEQINGEQGYGIENLTWTPSVIFRDNVVRNNRARGALFSTPRPTLVADNLFDHTSGSAILLCGDCNGWYETGACRDITITGNKFVNALTNMFQFTNAVISIYPEIPNLDAQNAYFHSGINIHDNEFITFDYPLLYAKSVDGITFKNNVVKYNRDFPPFHSKNQPVTLERVINADIEY